MDRCRTTLSVWNFLGPVSDVKGSRYKRILFTCYFRYCYASFWQYFKQLLDEVFVITLTETLIILDITKTESNNCFIIHWTKKNLSHVFCFFTDGKQHKARELDMITLRNHAPWSYMTWLPVTLTWLLVTLTWLLYNLQFMTSRALISKIRCTLSANQKRVREFNV